MKLEYLDYILVPLGMGLMVFYHLWLLHRIIHRPSSTVVGLNAFNRRLWVQAMMEVFYFSFIVIIIFASFI